MINNPIENQQRISVGKSHRRTSIRHISMKTDTDTAPRVVGENAKQGNNEISQNHHIGKNYKIPNESRPGGSHAELVGM